MTFREMIALYKAGTLHDEQKALLESEIEKHEAISDYLFDEADLSLTQDSDGENDREHSERLAEAAQFTDAINASIRRAFVRTGVIVGTIILAIVLSVIFVLPHAVSLLYYNPGEVVGRSAYGFETTQFDLDLSVFTELFLGGTHRNTANIEPEGYGEYSITIPQITSVSRNYTTVNGKITRNELLLYDPNLLTMPTGNAFVINEKDYHIYTGESAAVSTEEALAADVLDENNWYTAYFSLNELKDYEDFYRWYESLDARSYYLWCAVYTGNCSFNTLGFCPQLSGRCIHWDTEAYPYLTLLTDTKSIEQHEAERADGAVMSTHFVSMLSYMNDHPHTAELFGVDGTDWNGIIDYVEENGIKILGFAVSGTGDALRSIAEENMVSYVYAVPMNNK